MTVRTSGPISLLEVQAEFGGADPIGVNEYYRGGVYVNSSTAAGTGSFSTLPMTPASPSQIPSGTPATGNPIQLTQFYGTQSVIIGNSGIITAPVENNTTSDYVDVPLPAGVDFIRYFLVGGGGGGAGSNTRVGGDGGGGSTISGTASTAYFGAVNTIRTLRFFIGRAGQGGLSRVGANSIAYPPTRGGHGYPMTGIQSVGSWGQMMNTYAVTWDQVGGTYQGVNSTSRTINFPVTGSYQFQFAADNYITIYLDGVQVADDVSDNAAVTDYGGGSYLESISTAPFKSVFVTAGLHKITISTNNTGSIGGYAVRILNPSSAEIWTTRYDTGYLGTPAGGSGGPTGGNGASGMGGGGGSATRLTLIIGSSEYMIAVAGGGGAGGGGGDAPGNGYIKGNWASHGFEETFGYPGMYPGGEGEYTGQTLGGTQASLAGDGGGGGGGGGGIFSSRPYMQQTNKQWPFSGFGGRTVRGSLYNGDCDADGGQSGKSWRLSALTKYADFLHVPTTSRLPIFGSNIPVSLAGYGVGGVRSTIINIYPGNASVGTVGAAYVDWGLTNASVTAPSVTRSPLEASILFYELVYISADPSPSPSRISFDMYGTGTTSFVVDAFGAGGNPSADYTYSWSYLSGDGISFNSPNSPRTVVNFTVPAVDDEVRSGSFRVTVSDGTSSTTHDKSWWATRTPAPSGG